MNGRTNVMQLTNGVASAKVGRTYVLRTFLWSYFLPDWKRKRVRDDFVCLAQGV